MTNGTGPGASVSEARGNWGYARDAESGWILWCCNGRLRWPLEKMGAFDICTGKMTGRRMQEGHHFFHPIVLFCVSFCMYKPFFF